MKLLPLLLKEDIYGENAIVYHRTRRKDLIDRIHKFGFIPGGRHISNDYGDGFYATYELRSQLRSYMRNTYGDIIVKFSCPTTNFFFCDWEEFKKTGLSKKLKATEDDFIFKQLDHYKVKYDNGDIRDIDNFIKTSVDSERVSKLISHKIRGGHQILKGIIFTDSENGQTLVSYDTKRIIPLSFTEDEGKTWIKVDKNLDYIKKALKAKNTSDNKQDVINKDSIEYKLIEYDIENYIIQDDGTVDVDGDVVIFNKSNLTRIPFKFGKVTGNFELHNNYLFSLEGSPVYVGGDYIVAFNNLSSLKGAPERVEGSFNAMVNKITSLKYSPKYVGGDFVMFRNRLNTLKDGPEYVGGDYNCLRNPDLKSLDGITKKIGGEIETNIET